MDLDSDDDADDHGDIRLPDREQTMVMLDDPLQHPVMYVYVDPSAFADQVRALARNVGTVPRDFLPAYLNTVMQMQGQIRSQANLKMYIPQVHDLFNIIHARLRFP